jgi:ketosteroid isomerase-like protein
MMRFDPEGVLESAVTAYALGDWTAAIAYFAEDASFAIHVDEDILPFGGEVVGRSEIREKWHNVAASFELLRYAPRSITGHDDIARCQIEYGFRHRASGEVIDGVLRVVVQVVDGRIVQFREYHDRERIRAFMRLVATISRGEDY